MRMEGVFRVLFVFYCLEAGAFLLVAPWTPAWDRNFVQLTFGPARDLLLHSWFRGAVTGFGAVHLLWVIHDAVQWWSRRHGGSRAVAT
jgi:hypothetical protein